MIVHKLYQRKEPSWSMITKGLLMLLSSGGVMYRQMSALRIKDFLARSVSIDEAGLPYVYASKHYLKKRGGGGRSVNIQVPGISAHNVKSNAMRNHN